MDLPLLILIDFDLTRQKRSLLFQISVRKMGMLNFFACLDTIKYGCIKNLEIIALFTL